MRKILFFILLSFACVNGVAQVGGKHVYSFLNLAHGPRQSALGGKVITLFDYDPSAAILNPASINTEMHNQIALNYTNYIADVNYETAAYAMKLDETNNVLHAVVNNINSHTVYDY